MDAKHTAGCGTLETSADPTPGPGVDPFVNASPSAWGKTDTNPILAGAIPGSQSDLCEGSPCISEQEHSPEEQELSNSDPPMHPPAPHDVCLENNNGPAAESAPPLTEESLELSVAPQIEIQSNVVAHIALFHDSPSSPSGHSPVAEVPPRFPEDKCAYTTTLDDQVGVFCVRDGNDITDQQGPSGSPSVCSLQFAAVYRDSAYDDDLPPSSPPSSPVRHTEQTEDDVGPPSSPVPDSSFTPPSSPPSSPRTRRCPSPTAPIPDEAAPGISAQEVFEDACQDASETFNQNGKANHVQNKKQEALFTQSVQHSADSNAVTSTSSQAKPAPLGLQNKIPYPKRPTLASQKIQAKKLSQPFRSPLRAPPTIPQGPLAGAIAHSSHASDPKSPKRKKHGEEEDIPQPITRPTIDPRAKHRTQRAAAQFKSPVVANAAADNPTTVRLTPTIQTLERKLQLARRAIKIKEDGHEGILESLAKKWTEAGRDVAWEVWNLVKDNVSDANDGTGATGHKRGFHDSWGWEEQADEKRRCNADMERNWGWEVAPVIDRSESELSEGILPRAEDEEEEAEARRHDIGAMLIGLGISPETLGWSVEEGDFVDV